MHNAYVLVREEIKYEIQRNILICENMHNTYFVFISIRINENMKFRQIYEYVEICTRHTSYLFNKN